MRYFFRLLIVMAVLIVLCASRDEMPAIDNDCNDNVCQLSNRVLGNRTVFKQENWSFTVPDNDWDSSALPDLDIKVASKNENKNCLVVFNKGRTADSFTNFVIKIIRSFSGNENAIYSVRKLTIHNNQFIELEVHGDMAIVWDWLTVKDGFEYELSCGGDIVFDGGTATYDLCQDIANTIEIK